MGKWLDRLAALEAAQKANRQNCQKSGIGAFVGFVGSVSGQDRKYPAVWSVVLSGAEKGCTMTVIDPDQMPDNQFFQYLSDKFGADRVLSASRKAMGGNV